MGNSYFCVTPKNQASRVCINFVQFTQKILTKGMITKLCQNINKKTIFLTYFGPLQIIHAATYITLFLPNSNNFFSYV